MYEKSHEDSEAEFRVGMIGGECDKTFRKLVQCDGNGSLKADGEESICVYMVVVLLLRIIR